ncbi:MAG: sulfatase [Verrucomicrobiota bacterium]
MKVIMVMFDSLNRHLLPPYGCDWVQAPNFQRLAQRSVTFDTSYVCSMPCMPARRELHTARPNFLHRSWSPLEPFDDSVPAMLSQQGVYSHLVSDHYHYWEDGGATYHNRYNSWEFMRGQEADRWMGQVTDPPIGNAVGRNAGPAARTDRINRQFMRREADQPQAKTFAAGLDFIRRNRDADRWFLQIETFDPHEPFFTQTEDQDLYRDLIGTGQPLNDWPGYGRSSGQDVSPMPAQLRGHYAALVTMCDRQLGAVLDLMDELKLWDDTMLMVWTDHGFLLGEHDCWAKCVMPFYEEVARTPFFVWDPRCRQAGERRRALVQPATLAPSFAFTKGCPLLRMPGSTWVTDESVWQTALYDLATDPKQERPITDPKIEQMMIAHLVRLMRENDAPAEQFIRLGLPS